MIEASPLYIVRTPWRHRRIVWPGMPFRTLPFPYLFHRFDVVYDVNEERSRSWAGSFWRCASAERFISDFNGEG